MSLERWVENGWLHRHEPSRSEIADLLEVADRALADARVAGLSPDARAALAYPAVLAFGSAALAAAGYRAGRERHHERIIDSLVHTIDLAPNLAGRLHRYRRIRNQMTYERVGQLSYVEAETLLSYVETLRRSVVRWLTTMHPRLQP